MVIRCGCPLGSCNPVLVRHLRIHIRIPVMWLDDEIECNGAEFNGLKDM